MKNIYRKLWLVATVMLLGSTLTSCVEDDGWWNPEPPPSWTNTFSDQHLTGYWKLVEYNSDPVATSAANYLYFNGRGSGLYYYMESGRRYIEQTAYWCQYSTSGTSDYQINLQYVNSDPVTANYWFTHNGLTLWMQWRTANGSVVTYVYDHISAAPW